MNSLHPIACTTCKGRKVKCDRKLPRCTRCITHNVPCTFPERQKKAKPSSTKGRTAEEIDALLERLQRVENTVHARVTSPDETLHEATEKRPHESPIFLTPASLPDALSTRDRPEGLPRTGNSQAKSIDVYTTLEDAVKQISEIKLRKTLHAVSSTQAMEIPRERSILWVKNYFRYMPANMTSGLTGNEKLMELMPDLISNEHVHIDPAIMVLYYVILYHGCCLPCEELLGFPDPISFGYVENTYRLALRSLTAWQRCATGSTTDLSAAILMTRAAVECHDLDLGYQLHQRACEFAEGLRIHRLDAENETLASGIARNDAERRRFWDLVQYDVYFRLMLTKPSAMSAPMVEWKVDLPYLNTGLDVGVNTEPAIMFLFGSQLTLEIATFYQILDASGDIDKQALIPTVERICRNMEQRYDEWQIDEVLARTQITQVNGWLVADAAIAGLMSIVLMLRKIGILHSPLVIDTSRHILRILDAILEEVSTLAILSLSFFSSMMTYMPYATVAEYAVGASDAAEGDMILLERIRDVITVICKKETDFMPLAKAMQKACDQVNASKNRVG